MRCAHPPLFNQQLSQQQVQCVNTCSHLGWRRWCLSAFSSPAVCICMEAQGWGGRVAWQPMVRIRMGLQWLYSAHRPSLKSSNLGKKINMLLSGRLCNEMTLDCISNSSPLGSACMWVQFWIHGFASPSHPSIYTKRKMQLWCLLYVLRTLT